MILARPWDMITARLRQGYGKSELNAAAVELALAPIAKNRHDTQLNQL